MLTIWPEQARNGEWLQPEFTIHGFRHAEITGLESLSGDDIEAVVIGSNISAGNSSGLRFGSALLQKIQVCSAFEPVFQATFGL